MSERPLYLLCVSGAILVTRVHPGSIICEVVEEKKRKEWEEGKV